MVGERSLWSVARERLAVGCTLVALVTAGLIGTTAPPASAAPCDAPVNKVACENTLPGNPPSQWAISGVGDTTIQGFATQFSVNSGQTVRFKVKTTASAYSIDIYRVGWYQGNGARKITTVAPTAALPQNQPACLSDPTTGLVDCGNWGESGSWAVPSTAVSGVYFAELRRTDNGGASQIFFVVRDDASTSKILFQTNDTSWNAYNGYGGNSLYGGNPVGRAYKVSYNRPFDTNASWPHTFFWQDQYPMIEFMERNGYDMSYISGVDADSSGSQMLQHSVYVSVGHDEYWSKQQRANVTAARDAGVDLAFFSGNEVFWKTRWESSIDGSGTARRTMVTYKETHAGAKIDPSPEWTGTWRDPRFSPPADGNNPENSLTGTRFMVNGIRNDTITVPQADGLMRIWRNTSVATQAAGATATLAAGSLGYEWDVVPNDATRPPGLIRLSDTTVAINDGKYLVDYGSSYGNGTANHALAMYKAASGALVFGAGTIRWPYGLATDNVNNSGGVEDVRMQQATVNLFADMGAQPSTIQSGLTLASASTDTATPTATITSPAAGTTVQTGTPVTISGTATDTGGGRVGGVELSFDGGASWQLATGRANWSYAWTPSTYGALTIRVRAIDDSLNVQSTPTTVAVNVVYNCPCSIWSASTVPVNPSSTEAVPVELGVKFRADIAGQITGIRFYKGTTNTGTHVGNLWNTAGTLLASATFTGESASGWQQVSFSSPVTVQPNTTYVASYFAPKGGYAFAGQDFLVNGVDSGPLHALRSGIDGGNGVYGYGASSVYPGDTFNQTNYFVDVVFAATGGTPDTTPPTVAVRTPDPGATGIAATVAPTATFSEAVQSATVAFSLTAAGGGAVAGATAYNAATNTATFTPTSALAASTTYNVSVSGAKDTAGNTMTAPVTWSFTTAAPPTCPCSIWSPGATPASIAADAGSVELGVKFRSDVAGQVTGIRFYKGTGNTGTHVGNLWSSTGTLLASATFTGESATGWQQVSFSTPVAVTANTTYVASYLAPNGRYAANGAAFASAGVDNAPLHALRTGVDGSNGVYRYGATSAFPNSSFNDTNYWVDVVLATGPPPIDTTPPTVTASTPAAGATGVATSVAPTATFSEAVQSATVGFSLAAGATSVPGATAYNATTNTATFTPSAALAASTTYTATVSGVKDTAGNTIAAPVTWSFTTAAAADTTPPTVTASTPAAGATGVAISVAPTATFSEAVQAGTVGFSLAAGATSVPGATAYNATTDTATFTPSAALAASTTYTATVSGVKDTAGNTIAAPVTWSFTTAAAVDTTPPTVTAKTPAAGATGVLTSVAPAATFSEAVQSATVGFTLAAGATVVPGATAYNATTNTATFTPTTALAASTTYTATISGVKDAAGNTIAAPVTWSFTTAASTPTCPCSIWTAGATPAGIDPDPSAIELGVKFRSDVAGQITGVRFYKASGSTGTHTGSLWGSDGTLLATATFTGESASGWQQVSFSTPVSIAANTTYVASYFSPGGNYSYTHGGFTAGVDNAPLHGLQQGVDGGNGVYRYGTSSAFPTSSYQDTNYWVDVVLATGPPPTDTTPPTVSATTPAAGATGVAASAAPTATFSEAVQAGTVGLSLAAGATSVPGTVAYNATTNTAAFTPSAALAPSTTYTATVSGVKDTAGNTIAAPVTWSFTTAASTTVTVTDTTVADFTAGTQSQTAVVQTTDGEVALAPTAGNEFSGTTLPSGWASTAVASGGTTVVGSGALTLNGNRVNTTATYSAGRSLEFVATLRENGQNVGFGTTIGSTTASAVFSVASGTLRSQTRLNNLTSSSTNLGTTYLDAPHRFRVDWNAGNVVYSVDGVVVATHARALTVAMPLVVRDSTTGAVPLVVDWMRLGPYPTAGTFTSRVLDAGQSLLYDTLAWSADVPTGASVAVQVRTGNTATPDGTWSAFSPVTSGSSVGQTARYAQYQVTLTRGTAVLTPALNNLSVTAHS